MAALSCRPEEEKFTFDTSASLRFSTDTVFFDTLFTTLGSVTKRFKVFNDSKNAVNISDISLNSGQSSPFSIYVNGLAGPSLQDVRILGHDSILVLTEVTIDPKNENLAFLVTDQINFKTNGNDQNIKLVAWGQDANFLRDSVLVCNTTWTAEKPYVIYNSVFVNEGCLLTIEEGTKIYSHNGSFIFVQGSIIAKGSAENRILFTNDRFDGSFANAPGQWGGLIFLQGSNKNSINFSDIRNAEVGIYLGTPDDDDDADLILSNTRIENIGGNSIIPTIDSLIQPGYGIIAITSDLYAYNVLVNNCQLNVIANLAGGNYRYEHCTFANYSVDFFRQNEVAVFSDNLVLGNNSVLLANLNATLTNCILWGDRSEEVLISNSEETNFNLTFNNNIIRSTNELLETNNFLNKDPKFFDRRIYDYSLDTLSPAKDIAIPIGILIDMEGNTRDAKPDLGALERKEN